MKLIFAGSGSAFTVGSGNYQSNMVIQSDNKKNLLIDCGGDIRHALAELHLDALDIDGVYISHLHADHVGGLEWLAYRWLQAGNSKPKLYVSDQIVNSLWEHVLSGGLNALPREATNLSTFFDVHSIGKENEFQWEGVHFKLVKTVHVFSGEKLLPSYGLFFESNNKKVFITTDAIISPDFYAYYHDANIIFHDCETMEIPTGVHAHYSDLKELNPAIRKKMWLYHYNDGPLPTVIVDGFCGFVKKGQVFDLNHFRYNIPAKEHEKMP